MSQELQKAVQALTSSYKIHAIILFGSRARGDHKPWSDYDLLIIGEFDKPFLDRIGDVLKTLEEIKLPIEPFPYTPREAQDMLKKANPTIVNALEEGKPLYTSQTYQKLVKQLQELKRKGLKKTTTTITMPREKES
ncbi:MAG: nucleotidyltransferase domain-containing protein [Candidatus Methanomethylicota archaeon]|uniref:Nucleotidyltransferase domain-containing protein n=1 Tax=Thermoproteota archaeon TaxID=2056631 RepID=A0A497ENN0_9CREN|nr:MAG: nucleotidyltransferase domain-containing protein [Candidatus Verstraetearchaeota archaeon]